MEQGLHYDKKAKGNFAPDVEVNSIKELGIAIASETG
jgi:hypothetical protein